MKIAFVLGTRPEAIKLAPVIEMAGPSAHVCAIQQHDKLVTEVLDLFKIQYGILEIPNDERGSIGIISRLFAIESWLKSIDPELVVVQGDTTSAFVGAMAGYYMGIPVAHVEAGLRSFNKYPKPEETHRIIIDRMSMFHFCPSYREQAYIARENTIQSEAIESVGNTGIDSLLRFVGGFEREKSILVTCHRRENYRHLKDIAKNINALSDRAHVRYVVHPNPQTDMRPYFSSQIECLDPLPYNEFVFELAKSYIVLSDSGGLQEECPSLGIPIGILREETERPDVIREGAGMLLGHSHAITAWGTAMLVDDELYSKYGKVRHIYGDGHASERIMYHLANYFGVKHSFKNHFYSR